MIETATFTCSICSEPSTNICVYCTKDACANHRCERCKRCSDCCECELALSEQPPTARSLFPKHEAPPVEELPEPPEPEPPPPETLQPPEPAL